MTTDETRPFSPALERGVFGFSVPVPQWHPEPFSDEERRVLARVRDRLRALPGKADSSSEGEAT